MYRKKIAIYVEGQTEQFLLNHLIKLWWQQEVHIQNIQLQAGRNTTCMVVNHLPFIDIKSIIFFLIIDIQGEGNLASAIASRSSKQHQEGYEIIGLRDLYARDFELLNNKGRDRSGFTMSSSEIQELILKKIKAALTQCVGKDSEKITIYLAIKDIEGWLLAFTTALSHWSGRAETEISQLIRDESNSSSFNSEMVKAPYKLIQDIGKLSGKTYKKSLSCTKSLVKEISLEEIKIVCEQLKNPSFNTFWSALVAVHRYIE